MPPEGLDQLHPAERRLHHRQPERHRHPLRQPLGDDRDQVGPRHQERQRQEPDDPAFDPVWSAAADLGAVVFIHPWGCSLGPRLGAHFLGNTFGQPAETALALSHLIFGGALDRHRRLRLLAAHGGGFLPAYIGRSDHAWAERPDARGCAHPPSAYLRRVWYDALVYSPQALRHLVEVVGSDKVMLGTDYPFDMGVTDPVERASAAGLPAADLTAILSGNAAALFGIG